MHKIEPLFQDSQTGNTSVIIEALIRAVVDTSPQLIQMAVAYTSMRGVTELIDAMRANFADFDTCKKRWLTSIDFGQTDPRAISYLNELDNSEVRIANGYKLLASKLQPAICFHPKAYYFGPDGKANKKNAQSLLIGSANLSLSALHANTEHGLLVSLWGKVTDSDASAIDSLEKFRSWWEDAWSFADVADDEFIVEYTSIRGDREQNEDPLANLEAYVPEAAEIHMQDYIDWANAKCFWIQTHELYKNRGIDNAGNQLDAKRGTRVFFGFTPNQVDRNTVFGYVNIQYGSKAFVERSVRFGNNSMDKINLPIPITDGPKDYDNSVLHFEKVSPKCFRLTKGGAKEAKAWKLKSSGQGMLYMLGNDREFGFYS